MTSLDQSRIDAVMNQRQREALQASRQLRQEAVAQFPLMAIRLADDLRKLGNFRLEGIELSLEAEELADHLEADIRKCFVKTFGHDMIASEDQPNVS